MHGCKIAIMGRRKHVLDEAVAKLLKFGAPEAIGVQGDVRKYSSAEDVIQKVVDKYGHLNYLVNSAAGNFLCSAHELSSNAFKTVIDIDLNGTFNMCRAAHQHLTNSANRAASVILNITATLHYGATHYQLHPSAAKAGVDALTRNLAVEWGPKIRTVGIAPGPIGGTEGMRRLSALHQASGVDRVIPVGRLGKVEDIANCAVYLLSDFAGFISGETLVVDGGAWLYKPPMVTPEQMRMVTKVLRDEKKQRAGKL
eukprot:TRINITY_DN7198_c0_g1_i1.p1 TRINITY_DN7198_c0_g1~~TRINITY_DN7198_c0_g1_i1.p1  ORF type:complete len:255 (-),score=33.31 TRINITY_DN7198_c0_g1_i1:114-878(-)